MFLTVLWTIALFVGGTSALLKPQLQVPPTVDARRRFAVKCLFRPPPTAPPAALAPRPRAGTTSPPRGTFRYGLRKREAREAIHSVKLYAGGAEVFRYFPSDGRNNSFDDPPRVRVVGAECGESSCEVRVRARAGRHAWRCDLSAEGPEFHIESVEAVVEAIARPVYGPTVVGEPGTALSAGAPLALNCSTDLAWPPVSIEWLVDGVKVDQSQLSELGLGEPDELGLRKSWRTVSTRMPAGDADVAVECVSAQPGVGGALSSSVLVQRATPRLSKYTASSAETATASGHSSFNRLASLLLIMMSLLLNSG